MGWKRNKSYDNLVDSECRPLNQKVTQWFGGGAVSVFRVRSLSLGWLMGWMIVGQTIQIPSIYIAACNPFFLGVCYESLMRSEIWKHFLNVSHYCAKTLLRASLFEWKLMYIRASIPVHFLFLNHVSCESEDFWANSDTCKLFQTPQLNIKISK